MLNSQAGYRLIRMSSQAWTEGRVSRLRVSESKMSAIITNPSTDPSSLASSYPSSYGTFEVDVGLYLVEIG